MMSSGWSASDCCGYVTIEECGPKRSLLTKIKQWLKGRFKKRRPVLPVKITTPPEVTTWAEAVPEPPRLWDLYDEIPYHNFGHVQSITYNRPDWIHDLLRQKDKKFDPVTVNVISPFKRPIKIY